EGVGAGLRGDTKDDTARRGRARDGFAVAARPAEGALGIAAARHHAAAQGDAATRDGDGAAHAARAGAGGVAAARDDCVFVYDQEVTAVDRRDGDALASGH